MKLSFPISTLNAHTYFFAISEKRLHENSGVQRGGRTGRRPRASKEWNHKNLNAVTTWFFLL